MPYCSCTQWTFEQWVVFFSWQGLAMLVASTGAFSQLLANRGYHMPTTQSFLNYVLLSLHLLLLPWTNCFWSRNHSFQRLQEERIRIIAREQPTGNDNDLPSGPSRVAGGSPRPVGNHIAWWKYFLLALVDVEGNFLVVKAYQYTTIASVQLLDCFTIPVVMVLSRVFFKRRFTWWHLLGAFACVLGLALLVLSDTLARRPNSSASNSVLGDCLVLCGCVLYACSNVGQETVVNLGTGAEAPGDSRRSLPSSQIQRYRVAPHSDDELEEGKGAEMMTQLVDLPDFSVSQRSAANARHEYLAMIGIFGMLVSSVQMALLERDQLRALVHADLSVLGYLGGFALSLILIYICTPMLLQRSSAVLMNLSFLTADFWAVLLAVGLFSVHLTFLYFGAFLVIIIGVAVYHSSDDATEESAHNPDEHSAFSQQPAS